MMKSIKLWLTAFGLISLLSSGVPALAGSYADDGISGSLTRRIWVNGSPQDTTEAITQAGDVTNVSVGAEGGHAKMWVTVTQSFHWVADFVGDNPVNTDVVYLAYGFLGANALPTATVGDYTGAVTGHVAVDSDTVAMDWSARMVQDPITCETSMQLVGEDDPGSPPLFAFRTLSGQNPSLSVSYEAEVQTLANPFDMSAAAGFEIVLAAAVPQQAVGTGMFRWHGGSGAQPNTATVGVPITFSGDARGPDPALQYTLGLLRGAKQQSATVVANSLSFAGGVDVTKYVTVTNPSTGYFWFQLNLEEIQNGSQTHRIAWTDYRRVKVTK